MATYVLTVLGDDRPGLVDRLSGVLSMAEGNWARSQLARLGGKFAGIVEVHVPESRIEDLRSAVDALHEETGLEVRLEAAGPEPDRRGPRVRIGLVGADRVGLVHSVSAALAAVDANIEELSTTTTSAPMSGAPLFEAQATVVLPANVGVEELRRRLEALADHLMVDIDLSE